MVCTGKPANYSSVVQSVHQVVGANREHLKLAGTGWGTESQDSDKGAVRSFAHINFSSTRDSSIFRNVDAEKSSG